MKILNKETIAETPDTKVTKLEIESPLLASKAQPGQFIVVMVKEEGERIPLTVFDRDLDKGTISLIVQEIGFSTKLLCSLDVGDSLYGLVGPLGHATEIANYGKVILVAGGVGIAEIHLLARALKDAGNHVISILGARTKDLLILEDELKAASSEIYTTTDDGTSGRKGFTTDVLKELLEKEKHELVYAVGPIPMMRLVSEVTKGFDTKTMVSLNALMVDATGMCGGCRVTVGDEAKFSCVDGPEFDGHLVDWDELTKRTKTYIHNEGHICKMGQS